MLQLKWEKKIEENPHYIEILEEIFGSTDDNTQGAGKKVLVKTKGVQYTEPRRGSKWKIKRNPD